MIYGQMAAGSSIDIRTQGILQGTYETFAALAEKGVALAGRVVASAGLGGMGSAQPLAVTRNGSVIICLEVDPRRIHRRQETLYLDRKVDTLEQAVSLAREAAARKEPLSIGLLGNAAEALPRAVREGFMLCPFALSADYLRMAASELASISERCIERLVNPQLSGSPAFLVNDSGLNSAS
jgi:urocanate hydratase